MSYTVFETNVAQSANLAAGQAVAAFITANASVEGAAEVYDTIFDTAFAKLKAVFDGDEAAKKAGESGGGWGGYKGGGAPRAPQNPGDTVFNFGAVKGLKVSEVAEMDEAALKAHGEKLVEAGWSGTPYEKGGQAYLDYVAGSKNDKLSFMTRVVKQFLDEKRA